MSMHVGPYTGDINPGDIIDIKALFATTAEVPFTTASISGVTVYKDNSTSGSTSGVAITTDFNSITGLLHVRITTASSGAFYSAGSNFAVIITTGTVNSVSVVGYVLAQFSIQHRSALMPATAGRTLGVNSTGQVGLDFNNVNNAGSSTVLTNITVPTVTTLTNAPSDTSGTTTLLSRIGSSINITGGLVDINNKTGFSLTSAYNNAQTAAQDGDNMGLTTTAMNALLDLSNGVETGFTLRQALRLMLSALCGQLSGAATTTVTIRDVNNTTNRIVATVDSNGNRSAVTLSD